LDRIGLGIQEHTPGFLAIPNNRVIAKVIIAPELIRQLDMQQQQQQQQSLLGFRCGGKTAPTTTKPRI
jgi:hypothetical protein